MDDNVRAFCGHAGGRRCDGKVAGNRYARDGPSDHRRNDPRLHGSAAVRRQSDRQRGGSEKMLYKIREGTIDGDRLIISASPKEGTVLRFLLTVKGDVMEGDVEEND